MPVLDFPVSGEWLQLIFYNDAGTAMVFRIDVSRNPASGALGLDAARSYYVYDFWNDRYAGKTDGRSKLEQTLDPGEARMLSVHAVQDHPQWISTNRHIMQRYLDLPKKPVWNPQTLTLAGTSSVVAHEPYRKTLALNGFEPLKVTSNIIDAKIVTRNNNPRLADLVHGSDRQWNFILLPAKA